MIVVDASVWVSAFVSQDTHHAASLAWLRQQTTQGQQFVAPTLLMAEVGGAVSRRFGNPAHGQQAVQRLLAVVVLRWVPVDGLLATAATRLAVDLRLRGADAVYAAIAEQFSLPLVSWDREQLERAARRITVRQPSP